MYKKLLEILKSITDRIKNELLLFYLALSIIVAIIPSDLARYIVLGIGLVGSLVYAYVISSKHGESSRAPEVYVATATKEDHFLLEIFNNGGEDILDFKVEIAWRQRNQEQRTVNFIGYDERPTFASPRKINVLRQGEKIYGSNIPHYSADGRIQVSVTGRGAASGAPLEQTFEVSAMEARVVD